MSWFMGLRSFLRRRRLDDDLDEELRFHLEMRKNHLTQKGMSSDEAEFAARRLFGNVTRIKEDTRSSWGFGTLEAICQDICFGFRMLNKNRTTSIVAVLSLGLGIGAATGIWTGVNAILLRPPPLYHESDQLITVWETQPRNPGVLENTSIPMYLAWKDGSDIFENVAAFEAGIGVSARLGEYPQRMDAKYISCDILPLLGVQPFMGRNFTSADERTGNDPVVILDFTTWERELERAPDVLGRTLTLDGQDHTIIGVLPERFWLSDIFTQLWLPLRIDSREHSLTDRRLQVVARLREREQIAEAQTWLSSLASLIQEQYLGTDPVRNIRVEPLIGARLLNTSIPTGLVQLMGAIAFVLLIACTNIANIMVGRSLAREREMGIRTALGAGRWRLMSQFFIESSLMTLAGGGLGLLMALWIISLFRTKAAPIAIYYDFSMDGRIIAFALAITLLTSLLSSLAPSWVQSRADLTSALKQGSSGAGTSGSRQRVRRALVIGEVALTLTLLVAAIMEVKSFQNLDGTAMGFDSRNLLSFRVELPRTRDGGNDDVDQPYAARSGAYAFQRQLQQRLESLPGVRSAAAVAARPLLDSAAPRDFTIPSFEQHPGDEAMRAAFNPVSASYFQTLEVPLIRGRYLSEDDGENSPWVAVINDSMARRYWPDQDPLDRHVMLLEGEEEKPRRIVGVVGNVQNRQILRPPGPEIYAPYCQQSTSLHQMNYVVRTESDPLDLAPSIRDAVTNIDPNQAVWGLTTFERVLQGGASEMLLGLFIQGLIIGMALLLSAIGIYGVLSYSIGRRTQEMGVRMALGADRKKLLKLIVGEGLQLAALGLLAGLLLAYGVTRYLQGALFGMETAGFLEFLFALPPIFLIAAAASYLPARRAARLDPTLALRHE